MLKKNLSQNRPNFQTQASPMSSAHTYILDENEGSSSQKGSMSLTEPDDDDDICPVCESECTCANRSRNVVSLPNTHNYPSGYIIQDASKNTGGKEPLNKQPPSLKIKLTLPPRSQSYATTTSRSSTGRSILPKQKSKSATQRANAGENIGGDASRDALPLASGGKLAYGDAHDLQSNLNHSIPKKRGRPTKAVIAAREAAKHAAEARRPNEGTSQSISNVVVARQSERSVSHRARRVNSPSSVRRKGKKLHGAAAASRARAQQRKSQEKIKNSKTSHQEASDENESSELSELDDDDDHPFGLPTFVPAPSSGSSSSDSGLDTDSDCGKDSIPSYPRTHHTSSLLLADNEYAQRRREYHNTWDIRVRQRSVEAEESSDEGTDTDSGEDGGEEEEGDDEAEENDEDADGDDASAQQLVTYSGIATGWTDDEESSFDAELFFANLSDSSGEGSGDEEMAKDNASEADAPDDMDHVSSSVALDAVRLSEIAAAGFLAPFADLDRITAETLPFGQGWDHLSLSSTFRDGLMDLDVESSRRLPLGSSLEPPIPGYEEAEAMMATSEEEEAVAMFDNCSQTQDDEDILEMFEDSDGGETTEDEFVDVDGVATPRREVLLRFPASLGAIDPMSTLSSSLKSPMERKKESSPVLNVRKLHRPVPKPSDILSGRILPNEGLRSKAAIRSLKQTSSAPSMGYFKPQVSDRTKHVVIAKTDGSSRKVIPCPYPAVRRLRGRGTSVSVLSRSGSDRSCNSRTPSSLAAARSPFDTFTSGDFDGPDDSHLSLGEPIQIDDVIDAKFLEKSDAAMPESTTSETCKTGETCESESERDHHLENLRRWDRIPIDAFRRTRALSTAGGFEDKMDAVINTPRAPRPSDGFSYGSASGGMMRGSPLSAMLWESDAQATHHNSSPAGGKKEKLSSLLVSPVLFPVRDGDSTPTAERQQQRQQQRGSVAYAGQHAAYTQQNIKSRKELRKEKKRHRKFLGSPASHLRHNHFPNAKNRASSSMQRMPSLSL